MSKFFSREIGFIVIAMANFYFSAGQAKQDSHNSSTAMFSPIKSGRLPQPNSVTEAFQTLVPQSVFCCRWYCDYHSTIELSFHLC